MTRDPSTPLPGDQRNSGPEHSGPGYRQLPARDYLALKAAVRDLVSAAGGPLRAASVTRAGGTYLSRYGLAHEQMHAPVDVIADLEAECGDPVVTRILADLAGFDLVPKGPSVADPARMHRHLGDVAKATGEVVSTIADAIGDGALTAEERQAIDARAATAETELAELRRDLAEDETIVNLPRRRG